MAQVVLVRHGETQWNRDRRVQGLQYGELFLGHPEFTLSEVGYTAADARPEGARACLTSGSASSGVCGAP